MSEYDYYLKTDFSKYAGQWVAIFNEKVVAHGKGFKEVAETLDKNPEFKDALITRIPEKIAQILWIFMDYKFKFKKERMENTWVKRPKIDAYLHYKDKSRKILAILDSGSDLNYLPQEIVEYFELPLSKEEFTAQGAEQEFAYKTSKIYAKLNHPHKSYRKLITVMIPVKHAIHKDIIFGTDFLKEFIVTLDYPKENIKLTESQKFNKKEKRLH